MPMPMHEQRLVAGVVGDGLVDRPEVHRAGVAVDQGDAVEEEAGGERAEQEVLHRGFLAEQAPATGQATEQVERQREHLERHEHREQVAGGREQHHPADREQQQRVDLGVVETRRTGARTRCRAARPPGRRTPRRRPRPGARRRAGRRRGRRPARGPTGTSSGRRARSCPRSRRGRGRRRRRARAGRWRRSRRRRARPPAPTKVERRTARRSAAPAAGTPRSGRRGRPPRRSRRIGHSEPYARCGLMNVSRRERDHCCPPWAGAACTVGAGR